MEFQGVQQRPEQTQDFGMAQGGGSQAIKIPYRANRAVVFNSDLFHETDDLYFQRRLSQPPHQHHTALRVSLQILTRTALEKERVGRCSSQIPLPALDDRTVALRLIATFGDQDLPLLLLFDPLREHLQLKAVGHRDDRAHDANRLGLDEHSRIND